MIYAAIIVYLSCVIPPIDYGGKIHVEDWSPKIKAQFVKDNPPALKPETNCLKQLHIEHKL